MCIRDSVSNPPFLGGKKISGALGTNYRELLVSILAASKKGNADLVAYFFLRARSVANLTGYVATNTIGQGDTSEVGLEQIIDAGSVIYRASSSTPWPGAASVEVAGVWISRGKWTEPAYLDGGKVDEIDEMLYRRSPSGWRPQSLNSNADQSFQGSIVLGKGFVMTPDEAQALIDRDERNEDVLFPYMGGEDLNQSPTLTAPRWVINFFDWPIERAQEYPDCFNIVEERVKPYRQEKKRDGSFVRRRPLPQRYWQYADKRPKLYRTIEGLDRVLAICLVSKSVMPVFVSTGQVISHKCAVFASDHDFHLGALSSNFHFRWACRYGSTLETRLNYSPSDVFDTFAQPRRSCLLYTSPSPRDRTRSRMPSSA